MKQELLREISLELNIQDIHDPIQLGQLVYSVAGKMALASLWDFSDGASSVSLQHFKRRVVQIFDAYSAIYPQLRSVLPSSLKQLSEEIYDLYRRTGFLYHEEYRLHPVPYSSGWNAGVCLCRGTLPDEKSYMSGLGFYQIKPADGTKHTVAELFGLSDHSVLYDVQELVRGGTWSPIDWPDDTEFLRLTPPFSRGYWKNKPETSGKLSMARYGEPSKLYALYRYINGHYEKIAIPEWRLNDFRSGTQANYGQYRRYAAGLLLREEVLPPIKVSHQGHQMVIKLGYRLPPLEEDFFRLYSWPTYFTGSEPQVFTRVMAEKVYPLFRQQIEKIGYTFVEE